MAMQMAAPFLGSPNMHPIAKGQSQTWTQSCAQTLLKLQLPSELWLTASKTAHKVLPWFESLDFYNWQDFLSENKKEPTIPSQFSPTKGKDIEKDGILLSHATF